MSELFVKASREKLRFTTSQGALTVEDLWDLPLTASGSKASLNQAAQVIARTMKSTGDQDFVNPDAKPDESLQMALDIVKYIIAVRQAENEAKRLEADKREKKQRLPELIDRKQNQVLEGRPLEELLAMANAL